MNPSAGDPAGAVEALFSESYVEGRAKFLAASAAVGAALETCVHPGARGPDEEELAIDAAWFGPRSAQKVALFLTGVHGLEAAAGSATVLQWIRSGAARPDGVAVMIVHALNAYGWAWSSRCDEDNVDLNRNCIDRASPPPVNADYRALHEAVISDDASPAGLARAWAAFGRFQEACGGARAVQALTGGQYVVADGLGYGGACESWSVGVLRALVRDRLETAETVAIIDWHTGIGPYGAPFVVSPEPEGAEGHARLCDWFGAEHVHFDDLFGEAGSPAYSGLVVEAIEKDIRALNGARVFGAVVEWGTYEVETMFKALVTDRWLRFVCRDRDAREAREARARLVDAFYPSAREWRQSVLDHGARLCRGALDGLQRW